MDEKMYAGTMPVLALRGLAVFPDQTIHFEVGRKKSVLALEEAMKKDQTLLLMPQKDISKDDPEWKDLYSMGTVAKIKQILRGQGETIRVLVTGLYRARIQELTQSEPYLFGVVASIPPTEVMDNLNARALRREAKHPRFVPLCSRGQRRRARKPTRTTSAARWTTPRTSRKTRKRSRSKPRRPRRRT